MTQCWDVVVIGAGPAGCATAIALAKAGVRSVLLLEAGEGAQLRSGESLPPDTRGLLERLGIWAEFLRLAPDPCLGSASSWGAETLGYNDFVFNPHGPGWHVDRQQFDRFLIDQVRVLGVELRTQVKVLSLKEEGEGFRFELAGSLENEVIAARVCVDASGGQARFACALGARRLVYDRLSCIAGFFELDAASSLSQLSLLEAVPDGWWYAARLPNGMCTVVLATDADLLREQRFHEPRRFGAALAGTRHVAAALRGAKPELGPLLVRSTASMILDHGASQGWLAVGDAASAFDPVCAQGLYKALVTGLEAAQRIRAQLGSETHAEPPFVAYQRGTALRFAEYRRMQSHLYGLEQRWPNAPFWQRRQRAEPHSTLSQAQPAAI